MMMMIAIQCLAFIVLPYTANLYLALKMKDMVKNNHAAQSWLQKNAPLFILLTVLCGGVHPALCLCSSSVFGLQLFNTGLTFYELQEVASLRVVASILIGNLPQFLCLGLYWAALGWQTTSAMEISLLTSFLNIVLWALFIMAGPMP